MLRRQNLLLLGLCLLTVGLLGCGSANPPGTTSTTGPKPAAAAKKRFVFLTNGEDPFWNTCKAGWDEGGVKHELAAAGVALTYDKNIGGAQGQIDRLRQYGTQSDIVGVAISVVQADNLAIMEELRKLQKDGIAVITVDGDVNRDQFRDARSYYIGTDNIYGGKTLGLATKQILASRMKEKGGYVQFAGYTDNDNARSRMNGFKEALGTAFDEKDRMPDAMDRGKAKENVRNAIISHKDTVALIGIWAYNGPAIAQVLSEEKVRDKYTAVTFDAAEASIQEMANGNIDAMVVQNPFEMGQQAVRLLKAMHQKNTTELKEIFPNPGQPDGDIFTTGLRVVVPSNSSPVKAEAFDPKVIEFMLLPDFQLWLKKYNLVSS